MNATVRRSRPPALDSLAGRFLAAARRAGLWYYPDPGIPHDYRSHDLSASAVMVAILVIAFWLVFLSGLRWIVRIGLIAVRGRVGRRDGAVGRIPGQHAPDLSFPVGASRPRPTIRLALRSRSPSDARRLPGIPQSSIGTASSLG